MYRMIHQYHYSLDSDWSVGVAVVLSIIHFIDFYIHVLFLISYRFYSNSFFVLKKASIIDILMISGRSFQGQRFVTGSKISKKCSRWRNLYFLIPLYLSCGVLTDQWTCWIHGDAEGGYIIMICALTRLWGRAFSLHLIWHAVRYFHLPPLK